MEQVQNNTKIELLESLIATAWGIALVNPLSDVFSFAPSLYAPMRQLCESEAVWGSSFALAGVAGICAVLRGGLLWRRRMAALFTFLWSFVAFMFAIGEIYSAGVLIYIIHAGFSAHVYNNLLKRANEIKANEQ